MKNNVYWSVVNAEVEELHFPDVHLLGRTKKQAACIAISWWNSHRTKEHLDINRDVEKTIKDNGFTFKKVRLTYLKESKKVQR